MSILIKGSYWKIYHPLVNNKINPNQSRHVLSGKEIYNIPLEHIKIQPTTVWKLWFLKCFKHFQTLRFNINPTFSLQKELEELSLKQIFKTFRSLKFKMFLSLSHFHFRTVPDNNKFDFILMDLINNGDVPEFLLCL